MADTIGVKMKVEGESSFSKAMRDAARNTKALDAELKLAEAQFKASGDAEKLMADRGKILKEQLSEQEKAASTAKNMLQQLASAGYEQNSAKVLQWRQKLAQAEQKVIELNSAIDNNAKGLDASGKSYDSLGESMQSAAADANTAKAALGGVNDQAGTLYSSLSNIGAGIGWDGLSTAIGGINATIDQAIKKVGDLAKKIWDAGVDASVWADSLLTDSSVYGIDQETLQRWQYASRFIDTSVETIATARKKLTANMASSSKETALAFNSLHVATRDVSGQLLDVDDVFWNVLDAIGQMDNATERDALAMKTLGKGYDELIPLIEAGREAWDEKASQAPIISKDKVNQLGDANDAFEEMDAYLQALKLDVLSSMAPIIQQVAEAISAAAGSMKEFLDSDEGKEAMTQLQEAISGIIKDFTDQDFGQVIKDAATDLANFIKGFADLLSDKDAIIGALNGIAVAVVGMKLAEAAVNAMKLFTNLKLLKGLNVAGAAASSAGSGTAAAGGSVIGGALSKFFGSTILKAGGGIAAGVATFFAPLIDQVKDAGAREEAAKEVAEADKEVAEAAEKFGHTMAQAESYIAGNMHEWGIDADAAKAMYLANGDGFDAPAAVMAQVTEEVDTDKAREVVELTEAQAEAAQKYWDIVRNGATPDQEALAYQDLFDAFADDKDWEKLDALLDLIETLPKEMEDLPTSAEAQGENVVIGLTNGINKQATVAITAAKNLASAVADTIASALMIASPSKLMEQYGQYVGEGLAIGIAGSEDMVAGASRSMANTVTLAAPEISATKYGPQSTSSNVPGLLLAALSNMRVEIDGKQAGTIILPTIEDLMAEEINSRRYD